MAVIYKNRVKQVTDTTGGTGALTFASTPDGFQSFSDAGADLGDSFYYLAESQTIAGEWEVGLGHSDGTKLYRDEVISSSNSNSLVNFTAGEAIEVSITFPAEGVYGVGNSLLESVKLSNVSSVVRSSDTVTINFSTSHGLGDFWEGHIILLGFTPSSFNLTTPVFAEAVGSTTINFRQPGSDESAAVVGDVVVVAPPSYAVGIINEASGDYSTAFGTSNTASGIKSSAFGTFNTASGYYASAFGYRNTASGGDSSAFGYYNTAEGNYASAFGHKNTADDAYASAVGYSNTASGGNSSAIGCYNTASGGGSSAFGYYNAASGFYSSAFGYYNTADEYNASAVGYRNTASGGGSSAFGCYNTASGDNSSAIGYQVKTTVNSTQELGYWPNSTTRASAIRIHGTGYVAISAPKTNTALTDGGATAGSEADGTLMRGAYAIRINTSGEPILDYNDAGSVISTSLAGVDLSGAGTDSIAIGTSSAASGDYAASVGYDNTANGDRSSAIGYRNTAEGNYASAIGYRNTASLGNASAFGYYNTADEYNAFAIGRSNTASGNSAFAIGYYNTAVGLRSTAVGCRVTTTTNNSQEFGYWSNLTTRAGAIRIHGTGYVAISMRNSSSALTDGGATHGSEADGTLMREAYSIRRDGDDLYIDVNIGGTVKTLFLGAAT